MHGNIRWRVIFHPDPEAGKTANSRPSLTIPAPISGRRYGDSGLPGDGPTGRVTIAETGPTWTTIISGRAASHPQ